MKTAILFVLSIFSTCIYAQSPVLYINFVSHNEPGDNLQQTIKFNAMNTKVLQLAAIIDSKGASWNLETCDGYPTAAFNLQGVNNNIFRTITSIPYDDNIEIDPRPKTSFPTNFNIADTYRLLDTLGCRPTNTLGGFVYATSNQASQAIDWFNFQDTITGITYPWKKWKANLMWGAGSYQPHTNDLNDYGVWKPDTLSYTTTFNSFYNHNPNRTVWYISNGCQPLYALDSTENEQIIISDIKSFIGNLQNGLLPQNKFYVQSVTINQSHFGPTLFQKITTICDSINSWGTNKVEWATLTEKFSLFEAWQINTSQTHSQWLCGQSVSLEEKRNSMFISVFPNPTHEKFSIEMNDSEIHKLEVYNIYGSKLFTSNFHNNTTLNLSECANGLYLIKIDGAFAKKIIKE